MTACRRLLPAVLGCILLGSASPAGATTPDIVRLPEEPYFEQGFVHCDGFDIDLSGVQRDEFLVFFDADGEVVKVVHHGQVTETFANSVTGKTLTNRGRFTDFFTRVDGTEDFIHSVVGFDFMASDPGAGLVFQQVGRKVFSIDGEELVFSAGQSNIPDGPEAEAVFCAALT